MRKILIPVTVFTLIMLIIILLSYNNIIEKFGSDPKYGKEAHIRVDSFTDSSFATDFYDKKDLILINVWATWCKPCISELPLFERFDTIKNLKFINISMDKDSIKLKKFLDKNLKVKNRDITLQNFYSRDLIFEKIDLTGGTLSIGVIKFSSNTIPYTVLIKNKKILFKSTADLDVLKLKEIID